jgi:hypothetical protein
MNMADPGSLVTIIGVTVSTAFFHKFFAAITERDNVSIWFLKPRRHRVHEESKRNLRAP